eukprot:15333897-Alexandrium_andersonii.AAC.1
MSASLVGSEMCIRDRADAPRHWHSVALDSETRHRDARVATGTPAATPRPCLLYTSDAADDM